MTSLCVTYLITDKLIGKGLEFELRFQCFPVEGGGGGGGGGVGACSPRKF